MNNENVTWEFDATGVWRKDQPDYFIARDRLNGTEEDTIEHWLRHLGEKTYFTPECSANFIAAANECIKQEITASQTH